MEESASPVKVESKLRVVTQSQKKKKKARRNGEERANEEQEDRKLEIDSVKEDLSSTFKNEAKDTEREAKIVTAETVMGFQSCPDETNREIVVRNPGFVRWARRTQTSGDVSDNLYCSLEWLDTPEGQELDFEGQGGQKFGYGKYADKTFKQIANSDPDYHVRWMKALSREGREPEEKLKIYISFHEKYKDRLKSNGSKCRSSQIFTFGKYNGKYFREVARVDPNYHVRFRAALERKGERLGPQLVEYIKWFNDNIGPDPPANVPFRMKRHEF